MWVNVTVTLGQQLPLDHINHKYTFPSQLISSRLILGMERPQNVTNRVILSHYLTNIILSQNTISQVMLNITSDIHSPLCHMIYHMIIYSI